jgi:parvulin-like peptidyl-prolyl isomerase
MKNRSMKCVLLCDLKSAMYNICPAVSSVLFVLLLASQSFSQSANAIAKVGNDIISPEEFKYRFELSPHIFPEDETDIDSMKLDFLYSIIAEKLWADEADKLGYSDNSRFRFFFSPLKDMYVRDALFQKEIKSKVIVSPEDIMNGVRKISTTLDVSIITATDKRDIDKVYQLLSSGIIPDSLKPGMNNIHRSRQSINFGDLKDEKLETQLYSLLPGMITSPLPFDNSYAVFYLHGKENNDNFKDLKDVNEEVQKIIRNRRTERQYNIYLEKLLTGITIVPDENLFNKLADAVLTALNEQNKQIENEGGKPEKFFLDEAAIYKIKNRLGNELLSKPLFFVDNKSVSLSEFLAYFTLNNFEAVNLEKQKIYSELSLALKTFIRLSVITNEGYRQDLQNSPEVKNELAMWKSNYLAQLYKNQFIDSVNVGDEEAYEFYLESLKDNGGVKQVKVLEFRTDSLVYFEKIFREMENGKDFKDIINELKQSGINSEIKESGFFPVTANEIGRTADKMKKGEVFGPLKRFNRYEAFQLIDVKETADSLVKKYESVREGIRQELVYKKMAAMLTENTQELLRKYHVEINQQALQDIKTGSLNMFVHRYMGFGGRIAAVPYTSPIIDYRNIRRIMQEVLP